MKNFIFVSDFDGTISKKEFYLMLIDKYFGDSINDLFDDWKKKKIKDVDFLGYIFKNSNRTESEFMEDILEIELDEYFETFINNVKKCGGDFLILSAGTGYYIEKLLSHKKINDINVISNKGFFKDNGIHLEVDKNNPYYSEIFGIDKGKVVNELNTKYKKVFFAGDSTPDVAPSEASDIAFATGRLPKLLDKVGYPYIPFENFKEIEQHLINVGVMKVE